MQITFIVNSKIKKFKSILRDIGDSFYGSENLNTTILQTHHAGHASELAKDITQKGCDFLIAVGGDGTINEVLNGMMHASIPINNLPTLGVIPRGSANDFVKTLSPNIKSAAQIKTLILANNQVKIDLGKIELGKTSSQPKFFINIAGLGLGPEVVKLMEGSSKIFGSKMTYFSSIVRGFLSYKKRTIRCESEGWFWEGQLLQMAVANGKFFGDGICIAPDASVTDGLLQVSLFGEVSLFDYLKNLGRLKKGIKLTHSEAHYFSTKEIRIQSMGNETCGVETDGEYIGESPVTITIIPSAIKMIIS